MSSDDSASELLSGNQSGLGEGVDCLASACFCLFCFCFTNNSCSLGHNEMVIYDVWQSRVLSQLAAVPVPK